MKTGSWEISESDANQIDLDNAQRNKIQKNDKKPESSLTFGLTGKKRKGKLWIRQTDIRLSCCSAPVL